VRRVAGLSWNGTQSPEMEDSRFARRVLLLVVLAALWMAAVLSRLVDLDLFRHSTYLALALRQQERIIEISPKRGILYDRNGHELAMSVLVDSCYAVPPEVSDPDLVARLLAPITGVPEGLLRRRLHQTRAFVWIARKLSPKVAARIQALNLRGIYFEKERQRFYPKGRLAAQVLGYVDIDEHGLAGIEQGFDREIRGRPGRMVVLTDARHRWFRATEQPAEPGESLVLTLDENIQYVAEKALAETIAKTHAQAGTVVVEDPNTGALLALANWPTFDPNDPAASPAAARTDRAVSDIYEPGSTFKVITFSAALDEGVAHPDDLVDCQMGSIVVAGRLIHDWHRFGLLTAAQVLAHSSDVGTIKIALRVGDDNLYRYIRAFGFGQLTHIELPGETPGLLRPVTRWSGSSIGSLAIGQEIGITPLQLVNAVSAVANGGVLLHLHIVRAILRGGQEIPEPEPPPRRVIQATTAATLRHLMEGVVLEGTGRAARLDGYTAAGKTGTAQKIDPATGRYSRSQYIASFVGFAPVSNPAVTILVELDSPVGEHYGGEVAGPAFKQIAEQVLPYLNVPHDLPLAPPLEQTARRRVPGRAASPLALHAGVAQPAEPAAFTPHAEVPAPPVAGPAVRLPSFAGETVREAAEECLRLGLEPVVLGEGLAVAQQPEAGASLPRGGRVTIQFARPGRLVSVSAGSR
jgi:cell division protein FtsI (penicillin-binding protein 3)